MFYTVVQQGFYEIASNIIYFIDNLFLFPTVKNFQNQLTVDEVIAKCSAPRFFWDTVYAQKHIQTQNQVIQTLFTNMSGRQHK